MGTGGGAAHEHFGGHPGLPAVGKQPPAPKGEEVISTCSPQNFEYAKGLSVEGVEWKFIELQPNPATLTLPANRPVLALHNSGRCQLAPVQRADVLF